jgi:hypothetical protein
MSKRKRSQKVAAAAVWSDFELAFFAAAPPDEPQPSVEPVRFEEPGWPAPRRRAPVQQWVTIALAIVTVLIGLSAVVFAR